MSMGFVIRLKSHFHAIISSNTAIPFYDWTMEIGNINIISSGLWLFRRNIVRSVYQFCFPICSFRSGREMSRLLQPLSYFLRTDIIAAAECENQKQSEKTNGAKMWVT